MTRTTLREIPFTDAKNQLSSLTAQANASGCAFVITKNRKPWVEVVPLAVKRNSADGISIKPLRREVVIPDLDDLFAAHDGSFTPKEDGFASALGSEAM